MLTLSITTSTALIGVACADDSGVLASEDLLTDRRHAEELTPMVQRVVAAGGAELHAIDRLVVDIGPGRFTGLRVGLATINALALATGAKVVPATSLELIWLPRREPLIAVIDARRSELFIQRFDASGPLGEPSLVSPEELAASLAPTDLLVGDGADAYVELFATATVAPGVNPSAAAGSEIDANRSPELLTDLQPLYLRDADAKINIKTRP